MIAYFLKKPKACKGVLEPFYVRYLLAGKLNLRLISSLWNAYFVFSVRRATVYALQVVILQLLSHPVNPDGPQKVFGNLASIFFHRKLHVISLIPTKVFANFAIIF